MQPIWFGTKPSVVGDQLRRTDPRHDRRVPVELSATGRTRTATTKNLSLGGMFVETAEPVPARTPVALTFKIPTLPEPITVSGEVCWALTQPDSSGRGMGIRFSGLRARDIWALSRFFAT